MSNDKRIMVYLPVNEIRDQLAHQSSHIATRLRRQATEEYASAGHVIIDDDAIVGVQDDGGEEGHVRGWVAAWVFVEVPLTEPPRQAPPPRDMRDLKNWDGIPADRGRTLYRFTTPAGTYLLTPRFLEDGRFHGYNVLFAGRQVARVGSPGYGAFVAWEHQQEARSDADIQAGRTTTFQSAHELLDHIQQERDKLAE